jgi:ribosomal protein S18 acetylase RimI-like enzyme
LTAAAIRPACPEDLPALRALVEGTYRGDNARRGWTHEADLLTGNRTSDTELAAVIAHPDQALLVAEQAGAIIGTVTITRLPPDRAYLGMLSVAPEAQAGGLGRALLHAAEAAAKLRFKAAIMEMTVIELRTDLIAWYERRGYARTGESRPFPYPPERPVNFRMEVLERALR